MAPVITKFQQNGIGKPPNEPLDTVMAGAARFGVVAPYLIQYHSETSKTDVRGQVCDAPVMTVDTSPRYGLVAAFVSKYRGADIGQPADMPLQTITAGGNHFAEVRAFLIKYYGQGVGQLVTTPLDTITSSDRFGIVEVRGTKYQIVDIGMRMLEPRELYNAQGFPPDYIIDHDDTGRVLPKCEQVRKVGNSVPPPFGTAIVRANWPEACIAKIQTMAELEEVMAG